MNNSSWKDNAQWRKLIDGTDCPLCKDVHSPTTREQPTVAEFPSGFLRINTKKVGSGWYTFVAHEHAAEISEWPASMRHAFFDDVAQAAAAIKAAHGACKVNYIIYGNIVPHVHCHLVARRTEEDPTALIRFDTPGEQLTAQELAQCASLVRRALPPTTPRPE